MFFLRFCENAKLNKKRQTYKNLYHNFLKLIDVIKFSEKKIKTLFDIWFIKYNLK